MIKLRDYQEECVAKVIAAYEQDQHNTELLILPTGAGKTVIFCQLIDLLNKQYGLNTLIVAHRDELLDQAAEKYRLIKPHAVIGKIGSGTHQYGGQVTVASIATISRPEHLKRLTQIGYGLIIVDEAHHVASPGYQRVLKALPNAFTLMVTATPDRLDGKSILPDKEPLYSASIIDMIQAKYLCDMRAIAIKTNVSLDDLHTQAGDFKIDELTDAIDTPARNKRVVDAYQEHAADRRAICFAVTVKHAQNLATMFTEQGVTAACIFGDTPTDERKKLYQGLRDGSIKVLTNVMVLTEGFDEPLVDCIIMARPTQSRALYTQCVGRGLRLAPAKQDCLLLDLTDNCLSHRLQPQRLRTLLNLMDMQENETVAEAATRAAEEKRTGKAVLRKLNANRPDDVYINLLEKLEWQLRDGGMFVLEVGKEKHRIALVPSAEIDGWYSVWARLFPAFEAQQWLTENPLDWAQQYAEKQARILLADPKALAFVDRNASWRGYSASDGQKKMLSWYKIPFDPETLTRGEAAELIDAHKAKLEQKKMTKASKQKIEVKV